MMDRRAFVAGTLGFLTASRVGEAQQAGRVYRIGVLAIADSPGWEVFRQALRQLGYMEGSNTAIEWRWSQGRLERFPGFAAELVSRKVDLIVASSYPGTLAAKNATQTIPIIMVVVADPVEIGLVASMARPGGNITGSTLLPGVEIVGKYLELLKEAVPDLSRVAVLSNPANPIHGLRLNAAEVAGRSLRMHLQILTAQGPAEFDRAFAAMTSARVGALYVVGDPMFYQHRARLAELAVKNRLPAIYELKEFVEAGGLMAYGPYLLDLYRSAAVYADKIFNGAKPGDLPIEQPTKFELRINLKTAKALGLTIPPSVLARADEVIE
jgi:putative ABC transport system substrate-binding protein